MTTATGQWEARRAEGASRGHVFRVGCTARSPRRYLEGSAAAFWHCRERAAEQRRGGAPPQTRSWQEPEGPSQKRLSWEFPHPLVLFGREGAR